MGLHETLVRYFPRLTLGAYRQTSDCDPTYNCVAWAVNDTSNFWWPKPSDEYYWPADVPLEVTMPAFIRVFANLGYERCDDHELEEGFEKIAIFAKRTAEANKPKHAARQLDNGRWTSKIGNLWDIEHDLFDLRSASYGEPVVFMKRPRT